MKSGVGHCRFAFFCFFILVSDSAKHGVLYDHFCEFWSDVVVFDHVEVSGELVSDGLDGVDEFVDIDVFDELTLEVTDTDLPFGVVDVSHCVFYDVFICV